MRMNEKRFKKYFRFQQNVTIQRVCFQILCKAKVVKIFDKKKFTYSKTLIELYYCVKKADEDDFL